MGCDIHSFAEVRINGKWEKVGDHFSLGDLDREYYKKDKSDSPFDWRSYSMFAFLAGVRNYDHCVPISEPKGLPSDSEYLNEKIEDSWGRGETRFQDIMDSDYHSMSWLSLRELLDFDYDKVFWNRRVTKKTDYGWNGAALAEEGEGKHVSYRDNLGEWFFVHLNDLKELGNPDDVRVVFWFDN